MPVHRPEDDRTCGDGEGKQLGDENRPTHGLQGGRRACAVSRVDDVVSAPPFPARAAASVGHGGGDDDVREGGGGADPEQSDEDENDTLEAGLHEEEEAKEGPRGAANEPHHRPHRHRLGLRVVEPH